MTTDTTSEHWLETYRSLINLSIEGFKFSALVNGGAAVALLAYLGDVAGKGAVTPDMRCPMAAFLTGLAACGCALLFSYFTQLKLLNELSRSNEPTFSHSWVLWTAVGLFACSLAAFVIGSWQAVIRFR
jgi:hypothetical protein